MMTSDLRIQCSCDTVRGVVEDIPRNASVRIVCYCDDCQAYASFLAPGEQVLDAQGGTDIFQMSPAGLKFTQGLDQLACLRLSPKGPYRWYAQCCRTPIGNTPPTSKAPVVGLVHTCLRTDSGSLDDVLGPVTLHSMARYATNDRLPADAHSGFSSMHIVKTAWKLLAWRVRGDHKRSPFFDPETGDPVTAVRLLSEEERLKRPTGP